MTIEFLWVSRAQPTRGPKPALTLEVITDAAIAIADREGLAAVSMQRVAADLAFTKMSLYRYVPGKAELVAAMVERAIGEPPALDTASWRGGLKNWAHQLLAGYLRHPWALEATVGPRAIGPNELGWMERGVTLLATTELTGSERLDALALLTGHVRMIAQQAGANRKPETQLITMIGELLSQHGERFPALTATMASASDEGAQNQAFDFGLDRILDGLDLLTSERRWPIRPTGSIEADHGPDRSGPPPRPTGLG
ncbi:TetR/AcrR family transcriptional regulator [Micromonospora polyrhachis]|uniref:AcrR family transcriptional regulator n=1 Tax=Micromonospora polyrhachis TaxID=1282883 RepID=A0A7W7SR13_9ACTN|nr:TetR/AcrR family transcriptional regulator [Micromonospora polyrhachis]MBB4959392.1 AcrR family transcriptional regulator [Micromonospora polyrhachis]